MTRAGQATVRRGGLAQRCAAGLALPLRERLGPDAFAEDGRLIDWRSGLVDGLDATILGKAEGPSPERLREVQGAAALVLNSFAGWRTQPKALRLAELGPFDALRFDARCPTGTRGTPPQLDLLAMSGDAVVAVVARGVDYLSTRRVRVADAYLRVGPPPGLEAWHAVLAEARDRTAAAGPDPAVLARHAMALGRTFPGRRIVLLYLFWEPSDAGRYGAFAEHRAALASLAHGVSGDVVALRAQSFDELWAEWDELPGPSWLPRVLAGLRSRYCVAVAR